MHQPRRIGRRPDTFLSLGIARQKLPGRHLFRPIKFIFLQVPPAIVHGRAGAVFFKQPIKIDEAVETRFVADLADCLVGVKQQLAGVANPDVY